MTNSYFKLDADVTVITPCFNDGEFILEALDSILKQTVKVREIIIVDDGSKDETKKILEKISIENVKIIFKENEGVSVARNLAISMSKTAYILCLDADDFFEPTFVEEAVKILDNNSKVGIVGCYYKAFKENKSEIIKTRGGELKDFLVRNYGLGNSLFRKQCWIDAGGYDETMLNGYEDWDFSISILKNNWNMHIIKQVLFNYRLKAVSRDVNALKKHDFELRKHIFLNHKQVFIDNYEFYSLNLLKENSMLRKANTRLNNSLDYNIGQFLLKPIRVIRNLFRN